MAAVNNRRTQITKLLFKNSLIELMKEKPIGRITIKEICENAELSRSTFYLHYLDQYVLLREIENELMRETLDYMNNVDSSASGLSYIQSFLKYVREKSSVFKILLCRNENTSFQSEILRQTLEHVRGNIPEMYAPEMQKYLYAFLMQGCVSIIKEWIASDFDVREEKIAGMIFRLSGNALSTLKK